MKRGYELIGELVQAMVAEGCPPERAMRAESAIMGVLLDTMRPVSKAKEAAALLPKGAAKAAQRIGIHRATVYRRAARCRIFPVQIATNG